MRAIAEIQGLKANEGKRCIFRNLSRILDIRIVDINLESRTLSFVYDTPSAFTKVKQELRRIGYPMLNCICQETINTKSTDGSVKEIIVM